jgi:hypothetical protein
MSAALRKQSDGVTTFRATTIVACVEAIKLYGKLGWEEDSRAEGEVRFLSKLKCFNTTILT